MWRSKIVAMSALSRSFPILARRASQAAHDLAQPTRKISFDHGSAGDHGNVSFTKEEQERFGFPPAVGLTPGSSPLSVCKGGVWPAKFGPEPQLCVGRRMTVGTIDNEADANRVRDAMVRQGHNGYQRKNEVAPNCTSSAGDLIGAYLNTGPLAPVGKYVSGPALAQRIQEANAAKGDVPPAIETIVAPRPKVVDDYDRAVYD